MRKCVGIFLSSVLTLFQAYAVADETITDKSDAADFKPHFFTSLGFSFWGNFNDGASIPSGQAAIPNGGSPTVAIDTAGEVRLWLLCNEMLIRANIRLKLCSTY